MKSKKSGSENAKYEPTPSEQIAISKQVARRNTKRPAPRLKVLKDGNATNVLLDHPNPAVASTLLMEALGTDDPSFVLGLIRHLADAGKEVDEEKLNFLVGIIKGVEPNDQLEAMLAAQMAVVHVTFMRYARFSTTQKH